MIALLLILSLLAPAPLPVVLVTVEGGPQWTPAREARALADVDAALAWLRARGVEAPPRAAVAGRLDAATLSTRAWIRAEQPGTLTLYLVNNDGAPTLTLRGAAGVYVAPHRAAALTDTPQGLPALVAHELMHALTGLPDWPDPCEVDILCSPRPAYEAGFLGCRTLEALGRSCHRVYLPEVRP